MPSVLLSVHGLRDANDEHRVEDALRGLVGVFGAVVNHEEGCAEIDCDDGEVTVDTLIGVIEEAGFHAELAG